MKDFLFLIALLAVLTLAKDASAHSECYKKMDTLPYHPGLFLESHNKGYCIFGVDQYRDYAPLTMYRKCEYIGSEKYHSREVDKYSMRGFIHVVYFKCTL